MDPLVSKHSNNLLRTTETQMTTATTRATATSRAMRISNKATWRRSRTSATKPLKTWNPCWN